MRKKIYQKVYQRAKNMKRDTKKTFTLPRKLKPDEFKELEISLNSGFSLFSLKQFGRKLYISKS